ncbi:Elastase [Pseudomonas fluorescens]|uniref:Elastase n=1 Tax=Pseudomonas fluorescens TaxID=294 RepID=A0A5E7RGT6_PSEFL|nr:M4 family metallopeptidase [Pseudomonas fluorescens]VVP72547.1 Elastase [Pseudomonas fluorescens]
MHCHLMARILGALSILLPTLAHAASIEVIDDQVIASGVHRELEFKRGELQLEAKGEAIALAGKRSVQRMTQTYRGVPIYGNSVAFELDLRGKVIHASGRYLAKIEQDLQSVEPTLNPDQAVQALREQWRIKKGAVSEAVTQTSTKLFVYQARNETKARLIYRASYNLRPKNEIPSEPTGLIDAATGEVLESWDGVASLETRSVYGPGGNKLIGEYYYGNKRPTLPATQRGQSCSFDHNGIQVFLGYNLIDSSPWIFPCPYSAQKPINDGYSPINDLYFHTINTRDLYLDILGIPPVTGGMKVIFVPYGADVAIWSNADHVGYFAAGANFFYPVVSQDVVAHEFTHGFTLRSSGLPPHSFLFEAIADMAGEAAKFRRDGKSDFIVLSAATKPDGDYGYLGGLRQMCHQSTDGHSIEHASQFYTGMDSHYSNGVYNKAYCLLSKTPGWDQRKAFQVFALADYSFWSEEESFETSACGAMEAARALRYSVADLQAALEAVGVQCVPRGQGS